MPAKTGFLSPILRIEGLISDLVVSEQSDDRVLQFIVNPDDGRPIPVELRGATVSGVLADRHRVALVGPSDLDTREDRTLRPLKLRNLTTGGIVSVSRPGLRAKALKAGVAALAEAWKLLVGVIIGATLAALGLRINTAAVVDNPRTIEALVVMEAIWLALSVMIIYFSQYRYWRWQGGPMPVAGSIAIVVAGAIVTAGAWWTFTV